MEIMLIASTDDPHSRALWQMYRVNSFLRTGVISGRLSLVCQDRWTKVRENEFIIKKSLELEGFDVLMLSLISQRIKFAALTEMSTYVDIAFKAVNFINGVKMLK